MKTTMKIEEKSEGLIGRIVQQKVLFQTVILAITFILFNLKLIGLVNFSSIYYQFLAIIMLFVSTGNSKSLTNGTNKSTLIMRQDKYVMTLLLTFIFILLSSLPKYEARGPELIPFVIFSVFAIISVSNLDVLILNSLNRDYKTLFKSKQIKTEDKNKSEPARELRKSINEFKLLTDPLLDNLTDYQFETLPPNSDLFTFKEIEINLKETERLINKEEQNMIMLDTALYSCVPTILTLTKNYLEMSKVPQTDKISQVRNATLDNIKDFNEILRKNNEEVLLKPMTSDNAVYEELGKIKLNK